MPHALIGSYTQALGHTSGGGVGVQRVACHVDGRVEPLGDSLAIRNGSFICVNRAGDRAYVVSEVEDHGDAGPDGCVTTLAIDVASGRVEVLAVNSTAGPGPAHCGIDWTGKRLLVANYGAGNAVVYPLNPDGVPGPPWAVLPHAGHGANSARQEGPHPHAVVPSPDGGWLYVVDLGIDRIVGYRLDGSAGVVIDPAAGLALPPGSGPRHLAFAPGGAHAWVDLELSSGVVALSYAPGTGALIAAQTRASLAGDPAAAGTNHPSEIATSPDGRFVVVANRGRDCLTSFRIDPARGTLEPVHDAPVGRTPRHFAFTPDGTQILLAEQDGHRVTSHRFDAVSGRIAPTGHGWDTPSPCAVCFLPQR